MRFKPARQGRSSSSASSHPPYLGLALAAGSEVIAALEGTSPAFIRELLRRAALVAADEAEER
jgi:hypothetical protein